MGSDTPRPFNPHSQDAMFATVLARLDEQDRKLAEILDHARETKGQMTTVEGRITGLEQWREIVKSKVAVVSGAISTGVAFFAWLVNRYAP